LHNVGAVVTAVAVAVAASTAAVVVAATWAEAGSAAATRHPRHRVLAEAATVAALRLVHPHAHTQDPDSAAVRMAARVTTLRVLAVSVVGPERRHRRTFTSAGRQSPMGNGTALVARRAVPQREVA
jgi:hypothetical protein